MCKNSIWRTINDDWDRDYICWLHNQFCDGTNKLCEYYEEDGEVE